MTLNCLNQTIQTADEILELIKLDEPGKLGVIQSQTLFLYLALALNKRGNLHWFRGFVQELDSQASCQKAIDDFDRAEKLSKERNLSVKIYPRRRCECYLELKLFDKAITETQKLCESRKDTDNFLLLSQVFNAYGNYKSALETATEAMRYARNDSERDRVMNWQNAINTKLGKPT